MSLCVGSAVSIAADSCSGLSRNRRVDEDGIRRGTKLAPEPLLERMLTTLPSETASKIMPNAVTGCWEWIGARDSRGYGNVKVSGHVRKAHRAVYELLRGPISEALECDHLCRVPWCVNPDHLELVPHAVNVNRGAARWVPAARQRAKRRCPRGHGYTKANTYVHPRTRGRSCRECDRERKRDAARRREHHLRAGTTDVCSQSFGSLP